MVLILSIEQDLTTDYVIDWIIGLKKSFFRINDTSVLSIAGYSLAGGSVSIDLKYNTISASAEIINLNKVHSYWYRRGNMALENMALLSAGSHAVVFERLRDYNTAARNSIIQSLYFELNRKKHLGSFRDNGINKLHVLSVASQIGFKIPETEIVNTKANLKKVIDRHVKVITKGIEHNAWGQFNLFEISSNTVLLTGEDLQDIPEIFEYSLVQPLVEKYCEIRTFYLDGECYSCAIFSQTNNKTKIDYRNYDRANPNRNIPYTLPEDISKKVKILMDRLNLKTGSLDLILTPENELIFLEVNPIGQFSNISYKCNYYLEKKVAEYLSS